MMHLHNQERRKESQRELAKGSVFPFRTICTAQACERWCLWPLFLSEPVSCLKNLHCLAENVQRGCPLAVELLYAKVSTRLA